MTKTRDRIEQVAWALLGLAAGYGLWLVSIVILTVFGFSFAAVLYAPILELAIWFALAVTVWIKVKPTAAHSFTNRLAPLLIGVLITSLVAGAIMAIYHG
jgi:hypothetical protein